MTFEDFIVEVDAQHCKQPRWRYGQTLFNLLYLLRPDLSEQIRGTEIDPFYMENRDSNPKKWDACMNFISDNWEK